MTHPYARPCQSGPCTEKGISTPGFCKCKADAAEIDRLQEAKRRALALADERAKEANELRVKLASARKALRECIDQLGYFAEDDQPAILAAIKHAEAACGS